MTCDAKAGVAGTTRKDNRMAFLDCPLPAQGRHHPKGGPKGCDKHEKHEKHHDHCKPRKPKHCKHHHKPKHKRLPLSAGRGTPPPTSGRRGSRS